MGRTATFTTREQTAPKVDYKMLATGKEGALNNYRLSFSRGEGDWRVPRHRHNFDQIRFPLKGEYTYAEGKSLPAGQVAYYSEGTYYGPLVRAEGLEMVLCQWGGSSGHGFMSRRQTDAAFHELGKTGTFENGFYSYTDEAGKIHRRDSFEVSWERAAGRKIEYAKSRYDGIVNMDPDNFTWVQSSDASGVDYKWLGAFTERGTRFGFIRVAPGAVLTIGRHRAPELLFMHKGAVSHQGETYRGRTSFACDPEDGVQTITGVEQAEFLCIQLPVF